MKTELQVVMEKYKDNLFSAALNICKNAIDADDIVQDTFFNTTKQASSIYGRGCYGWQSIKQKMLICLFGGGQAYHWTNIWKHWHLRN